MSSIFLFALAIPMVLAFGLSIVFLPKIIQLSVLEGWFDTPDERKIHTGQIPRTGGMVLVPAMLLTWMFTGSTAMIGPALGLILIYGAGLYDDLKGLTASRKLLIQVLAAVILAASGWRLTDAGGLAGIHEIPVLLQYLITVAGVTTVVNAYNLIDGIDGLAAGLAVLSGSVFMWKFYQAGDDTGLAIATAMTGAYAAFLFFNFAPAKIFMGDAGSMSIGFILAVLSLRLFQQSTAGQANFQGWHSIAILSTPLYDVVRVIFDRLKRHHGVFKAERNHVHHLILNNGFSHKAAMLMIICGNAIAAGFALFRPDLDWSIAIVALCALFVLSIGIIRNLEWYKLRRERVELLNDSHKNASDNPFFNQTLTHE